MKASRGERVFYRVNGILLLLVGLSCLFPILHILSLSVSGQKAIASGKVGVWPVDLNFESYSLLLKGTPVVNGFKNSVTITVVGVALSMIMTILAAYPLSKKYMYGRKFFTRIVVFTMLFGGGLIPSYLVIQGMGLVNSYKALWLPGMISTYNMLVMRTFFQNIPHELEEAARIDGCSEWRLIVQIYLPLSMPCIATLSLFYGVSYWNAFKNVLIYINDTKKYNLSVLIQQMIKSQTLLDPNYIQTEDIALMTPEGVSSAGIMVMVIPMMIVYPFLQKYFVKGVMLGSVKG